MIEPIYQFERNTLELDSEWPEAVTEGWKAKPVGWADFTPANDADRREPVGGGLLLYEVAGGKAFVVVRFDPITETVSGARIVDPKTAEKLRPQQSVNERMVEMCKEDNRRYDWTQEQWAKVFGCSTTAVGKTACWGAIMLERKERKKRLDGLP